ncbi:MAG: hypothetical protein ABI874_06355 [Chloroflexota bacterium]
MEYDQQAVYEAPRPLPPVLWIGLTFFFALCCCFFFVVAGTEGVLLVSGATVGGDSSTAGAAKPTFGDIKFYADSACSELLGRGTIPSVLTTTKTIYACFPYSNMKSGVSWGYNLTLNDNDLPGMSKTQKWTKDGKGTYPLRLTLDTPLKPGDYALTLTLNGDDGPSANFKVGP